jgi:hypothetical protein
VSASLPSNRTIGGAGVWLVVSTVEYKGDDVMDREE